MRQQGACTKRIEQFAVDAGKREGILPLRQTVALESRGQNICFDGSIRTHKQTSKAYSCCMYNCIMTEALNTVTYGERLPERRSKLCVQHSTGTHPCW